MVSWRDRRNKYMQLVRALYFEKLTSGKQLPAFPYEVKPGFNSDFSGGGRVCKHCSAVPPLLSYNCICQMPSIRSLFCFRGLLDATNFLAVQIFTVLKSNVLEKVNVQFWSLMGRNVQDARFALIRTQ